MDIEAGQVDIECVLRNCTFHGSSFKVNRWANPTPVSVRDCAFDATTVTTDGRYPDISDYQHNAYTNDAARPLPIGGGDVFVATFNWQTNRLGNYYLPPDSQLLDQGSIRADLAGLYHYTTLTDQRKETNSMVDIGYHRVATDANGNPVDAEGDRLADYVEDSTGDGVFNAGDFSDWASTDSDYDGRSDYEEWLDGTDPKNANSAVHTRIGYWRFDSSDLAGEQGQLPIRRDNALTLADWSGKSLLMDKSAGSLLRYRETETNGHPNISCRFGTLRFWFKPNWSSTNLSGTGPGNWARLIEMGSYANDASLGWWCVSLNPAGDQLTFSSRSNRVAFDYFKLPIVFVANRWYQLALTYSPTNIALYTNGILATTCTGKPSSPTSEWRENNAGAGIYSYPSAEERALGFSIGCARSYDLEQVSAELDELETFNYPLTAQEVAHGFPGFTGAPSPMTDTDYDGRSDLLEQYADGTDPDKVVPCRLGYWRFNDSGNIGEQGQVPLLTDNVSNLPDWSSKSLSISSASSSRILYRDVETNGWANINCRCGSVRFWFKPGWNSPGGPTGAPFLAVGTGSNSWVLDTGASGSNIRFLVKTPSLTNCLLSAVTSFTSDHWYHITLTYCPTGLALYVNGALLASQPAACGYPNAIARSYGLAIGNSLEGGSSLNGQIDELETFNYPLTPDDITRSFNSVRTVDSDLNGVADLLEEITLSANVPFMGVPFTVTGVIEAEQFDQGGPNQGYQVFNTNNATADYRVSGLCITNCDDLGGGYCIDKLRAGEWLRYSIDVRVGQTYAIEPRVAGLGSNGVFSVEFSTNGITYSSNNLVILSTNWNNLLLKNVYLAAGTNVMRVRMLTNSVSTAAVAKLNYISIYPSWNEGIPCTAWLTNTAELTSGSDWSTASNNAAILQTRLDELATQKRPEEGGVLLIPEGTFYVAQRSPDESDYAWKNAAVSVWTNNIEIRGAGKTNTTLLAYNRGTTILFVGAMSGSSRGCTNVTVRDLTFQGSPHMVSVQDTDAGGFTNYFECGAFNPTNRAANGTLLVCYGAFQRTFYIENVLIENCAFKHADRSVGLPALVVNCLIRSNDFSGWEGTNCYTGQINRWTYTLPYAPWSPSIFAGAESNLNLVVVNNLYNGNVDQTTYNTNFGTFGPDGFVWFQGGGNWFVARNTITNYNYEAIQFNAGPAAVVQNDCIDFIHNGSTCALCSFASWPSLTCQSADDFFSFVGNRVDGGRQGVFGAHSGSYEGNRAYKLAASGNSFRLLDPLDVNNDFAGGAVYVTYCQVANIAGNTLLAGNYGIRLDSPGHCTNVVVLKNDFAAADLTGVADVSDGSSLVNVLLVKNLLGQGARFHVQAPSFSGAPWFLLQNEYRGWTNCASVVGPFIEPLASPVHFNP